MKKKIIISIAVFLIFVGCNEDQFLKEKPLDFASPENSFITYNDFKSSIYNLYDRTRSFYFNDNALLYFNIGTDLCYYGRPSTEYFNDYSNSIYSTSGYVSSKWAELYKIISSSNVIISRVKNSNLNTDQIKSIEAEARFFRGNAYKNLAHLFGGVPLELDEVKEPKTNYTRATREEVYKIAIADLIFASENLPGIGEVNDGEINKLAAYHMLAETYLCVNNYKAAIDAAGIVLNDPNTALMTKRFGTRSNEPGDVYWDLFQRGNQNRSSGNSEAIWVAQYELEVFGGVQKATYLTEPLLERYFAPAPRVFAIKDPNGISSFIPGDTPHEDSGRGVAFGCPTNYFKYDIWKADWNDMRNSSYNYIRNLKLNNPNSVWYGDWLLDHINMRTRSASDTCIYWYPFQSKILTVRNYPDELYENKELGTLTRAAGTTYADQYIIRLAETYLLRAEAYLKNGEQDKAAIDINFVRSRSHAINITSSQVNIDFILDERMRELGLEEKRRLTLSRMGLVYNRVSRLNEGFPTLGKYGLNIKPYNNLWPIPFSEIERNKDAVLEQNSGY